MLCYNEGSLYNSSRPGITGILAQVVECPMCELVG